MENKVKNLKSILNGKIVTVHSKHWEEYDQFQNLNIIQSAYYQKKCKFIAHRFYKPISRMINFDSL